MSGAGDDFTRISRRKLDDLMALYDLIDVDIHDDDDRKKTQRQAWARATYAHILTLRRALGLVIVPAEAMGEIDRAGLDAMIAAAHANDDEAGGDA